MNHPRGESPNAFHRWWLRGLAILWIVGFCCWFFSFDLPNQQYRDGTPIPRSDLVKNLSEMLLENLFPTPTPNSPPSGWKFFPQRLDLLLVASVILAGAWGFGGLVLRSCGASTCFDAPTRTTFAFGLGLSGISLLTLGCGMLGFLNRPFLTTALVLMFVVEASLQILNRSRDRPSAKPAWRNRRWDGLPIVCALASLPFVLAMLFGSMLPSVDFDVKAYHLEGAKEHFLNGEVRFLAHNVYTSFPFLTEMLSLLAMVVRDDWDSGALAGKVVLMSFAPLTALGLFAAGRRWFSPTVGWLAVLLYLSTPWIYRISIIAYAEGGLTFYLLATLLAALWATQSTSEEVSHSVDDPGWRTRRLLVCGLLAGSGVACKYPGVLSVAIPIGSFLLWHAWRRPTAEQGRQHRFRAVVATGAVFTLGTLFTFGPWMAKNVAETGNPVYPLLYNVFGGVDWDAAAHRKWQEGHPPAIVHLLQNPRALIPNLAARLTDVVAKSDWQSPLLFAAAPLALFAKRRRSWSVGLWIYVGWLFVSWWALTHQIDRFWVPMLPVVALLAAIGVGWLLREDEADASGIVMHHRHTLALNVLTTVIIGASVLFNLGFITTPLCGYNAYLIDLERAREDATTPSIALLHQLRLPDHSRVLFVGEAQVFDAGFDYEYNTVFDESLLELYTSAAEQRLAPADQPLLPTKKIRQVLADRGITHVFVNWQEILRYRQTYGYTDYVLPHRFQLLIDAGVLRQVSGWGPPLPIPSNGVAAEEYQLFEVL